MTTTAYVRDARFQPYGASVRWNKDKKSRWIEWAKLEPYLKSLDWKNTALLAHHGHFDGLVLTHHVKVKPAYYYDTLSMGRALYHMDSRAGLDALARHLGVGQKLDDYLLKGVRNPTKAELKKVGAGAIRDNDLMWAMFRIMLEEFPEEELDLIHYTVKCYTEPVLQVDKVKALKLHEAVVRKRKKLLKTVWASTIKDPIYSDAAKMGEYPIKSSIAAARRNRFTEEDYQVLKKELGSRTVFPEMLRSLGVEPPLKISPTWIKKPKEERDDAKKYTYAFAANDLSFLALKEHPNQEVRQLVEAKLLCSSSIHETRPLRMIEHADPALTIYLNYWGAKTTGRWSGGDKMNPQNLGRDGELRGAVLAPKGHKLVVGDSAAIEAVMNGWFAGQWDLLDQFRDKELKKRGEDPYTIMASSIFGRKVTKKQPKDRFVGKVTVLGAQYQMGAPKFQYTCETGALGPPIVLPQEMYKRIIDTYRSKMTAIVAQWWRLNDTLPKMMRAGFTEKYRDCVMFLHEAVELPSEMWLQYPHLRYKMMEDEHGNTKNDVVYRDHTRIYGGKLTENVIQAVSRVVIGQQFLRIADQYRMVLLAHDEIVLCVPDRKVRQAKHDLMETLCLPPDWCKDAPLGGEVGVFDKYTKM